MNLQALAVFVLPLLTGGLLAHIVWPNRSLAGLLFKASLGPGIGLGLQSLLYFAYLQFFAGQNWFIIIELAAFAILLAVTARLERQRAPRTTAIGQRPGLDGPGRALVFIAGLIFLISILTTANYLLRRRQGDWDAWMMYNRAARFVFLDQSHWLESFSSRMDPLFHADYPLLLALNISAGWQALGRDSAAIPMIQSGLFSVSCVGLMCSALASLKSIGQAAMGVILLWGIPVFVNEGARQMADVPLAFYVLATGSLMFMYAVRPHRGLLVLCGLTAGLAAWTKNEGAVLVIGASLALLALLAGGFAWRSLVSYGAGLAAPLAALVYFRLFMAPAGDMLGGGATRLAHQAADIARHAEILQYFGREVIGFGSWGLGALSLGILPILAIYYALFHAPIAATQRRAFLAIGTILAVQLLGYYAAFLITPYDLTWHLSYSTERLGLQVFPLLLFLILSACLPAESVLGAGRATLSGVHYAIDD